MSQINIDVSTPNDGQGDPLRTAFSAVNTMFTELYGSVVFQVPGKALSTNDFTTVLQTKLNGIAAGAEANVQSDLLQEDELANDFVKNKDSVLPGRLPVQIETYAGVSTFTLPVGAVVSRVLLVRTEVWENDEWTQTDNILTITKTMNTGNRIQINFY
jgi:hypothetical protein